MAATAVKPPAAPVKEAHGFELQREVFVKEYDSHMLVYKHKKTGKSVYICAYTRTHTYTAVPLLWLLFNV